MGRGQVQAWGGWGVVGGEKYTLTGFQRQLVIIILNSFNNFGFVDISRYFIFHESNCCYCQNSTFL